MTTPTPIVPQALGQMQAPVRQAVQLDPYRAFLFRQLKRIQARGGSAADLGDYLKHVEDHPGVRFAIEEPVDDPTNPGMVRGLSQQLLQGVTFGFGDEALGTLYGLLSGEGGQAGRDLYRSELASFRGQHKGLAIGANIAGAVGTLPLLPLKAMAAGGAARTALVGAGFAGLAGAGEAEGNLSDRAKAALIAAPFGAATALGMQAAAGVLGPIVGKVGRAGQQLVAKVAPDFAAGVKKLIDHLPGSPARAARTLVLDALEKDGISAAAAAERVGARAAQGLSTTLADVGGEHTLATALTAQNFRTPEQQLLVSRLMGREADKGARLLGAIGTGSRLGLQNAYELADQFVAERAARAAPLYADAFQQEVQITPGLHELLSKPVFQNAYDIGYATSLAEDAAGMSRGLPVPHVEDAISATSLPVRALDYMKRGLQHIIETAGREGKPPLSRQTASALNQRLNTALGEVDAQVPLYQQARQVWHSYSQKLEALEMGRENFFKLSPEEMRRELAASAAPEMYRIGQIQALADAVHGVSGPETGDVARRFMGATIYGAQDRTMLARIKTMFDSPSAAEDFADRLAGEAASSRTMKRFGQGAAPRPNVATNKLNPPGRAQRFLERQGVASGAARTQRARDVANELTMLFTKGLDDPNELTALLHSLGTLTQTGLFGTAAVRAGAGTLEAQIQQR